MAIQTGLLEAYPQAVDDTYSKYPELTNPTIPVGKGSSNREYAYWYSGYQSSRWTYWPFDLSEIPENAVIDSVKCLAKAGYYSASNVKIATLQLYCGNTAKGTATSFAGKTGQVLSVDGGSWTREELKTCGLQVLGNSVGSNATYRRFYFYGADLTVEYTVNNEKFMLKLGGEYNDIARVFKKVSGIWVEQEELANVVSENVKLQNGGEFVAPVTYNTVHINGSSAEEEAHIVVNGVKYSNATTLQVQTGDVISIHVFTDYPQYDSQYTYINVDGIKYAQGGGTYNYVVTDDCVINLARGYNYGYHGRVTVVTGKLDNTVNTIQFSIEDHPTYYAEVGMTWGEWTTSFYNNYFWYVNTVDNTISPPNNAMRIYRNSVIVRPTDVIVSDGTYYIDE